MDMQSREAIKQFSDRVSEKFDVSRFVLFGSRARGDNRDDSDADVAVFLRGDSGDFVEVKLAMAGIAFDVLVDTGIRIQPLPVWDGEWKHPEAYSNPYLLQNIAEDGITV